MNGYALGAAIAAAVLVGAHGGVGHGWHEAQLRDLAFKPTALVGDAEAAQRFFRVTWHIVTVFFLATAVALFVIAFGAYTSAAALHFIASTYVAIIGVCMVYFARRLRTLVKPIPAIASISMVTLVVLTLLAA